MRISIIGSGNVAYHLAKALYKAGHTILDIIARNEEAGVALAKKCKASYTDSIEAINTQCEVCIICVSDDAISKVAAKLQGLLSKKQIVAHTAGSVSISTLKKTSKYYGSFYPLQTFNKNRKLNYKEIPFCIHANDIYASKKLRKLAKSISEDVRLIDDKERKQIHLSAVWACNFVNHMIAEAEQVLELNHLDPSIIYPLIKETMRKAISQGAKNSQTGPAKRGDQKVIDSHIKMMKKDPKAQQLYAQISEAIQKRYK